LHNKKLGKKEFILIQKLLECESVEGKELSKKEPFKLLKLNGAINIERVSAQREKAYTQKEKNIFLALQNRGYNINSKGDLQEMIESFSKVQSRDEIQKLQTSTKAQNSESLRGLFISSTMRVDILLDAKTFTISENCGVGYFFFHTQKVELSKDVTIVGVENFQVVWFSKKYAKLFEAKKLIFVMINPYMLEWIESLENEYIHFGDFDLAGLNIYANRVVPHLKKSKKHSFFVPSNIEELIKKYGNAELYQKQLSYRDTHLQERYLVELREIMKRYKKVLEQEGIIHFN